MSERASLAISGSNLTGEHAFTCCLRTGDGLRTACPEPGQRGDLARLALDLLSSAGVAPADLDELFLAYYRDDEPRGCGGER